MLASLAMTFSSAFTALLLAAAFFDVNEFRIPNLIPLLVMILSFLRIMSGVETGSFLSHGLALAFVLALGFPAFAAGILGGGDVKLMAAVAFWFGTSSFADFIAMTGIIGGVVGLVLLFARRSLNEPSPSSADIDAYTLRQRLLSPAMPLPYALPISIAALWLEWFSL